MLKVLVFYLFAWWFVKLENKKAIVGRVILASSLFVFFLAGTITMFTSTHKNIGFTISGVIFLIVTILFALRAIFDIKKLMKLTKK